MDTELFVVYTFFGLLAVTTCVLLLVCTVVILQGPPDRTVLKVEVFEETAQENESIQGQILYMGDVANPRRYILTESKTWQIGDDDNWIECSPRFRRGLENAIDKWEKQAAEEAELKRVQEVVKEHMSSN